LYRVLGTICLFMMYDLFRFRLLLGIEHFFGKNTNIQVPYTDCEETTKQKGGEKQKRRNGFDLSLPARLRICLLMLCGVKD